MRLRGLLPLLRELPAFQSLADHVRHGGRRRLVLADAAKTFTSAALAAELERPMLIVVPSAARARQLVEQLRTWLADTRVVELFAERDPLPYERLAPDAATVQARLRALASLAAPEPALIVATARSLMDRLAPPDAFAGRILEVAPGRVAEPAMLAEHLLACGYAPAPVVEEPGTFSRRGGIVDVFPPSESEPIRIELFGDEIDSIRAFDPASQRSTRQLQGVALVPAGELFAAVEPGALEKLEGIKIEGLSDHGEENWRADVARLSNGQAFPTIAIFGGHLRTASLLDYLPPDGLLILEEPEVGQAAIEQIESQAEELYLDQITKGELPRGLSRPFRLWTEISPRLEGRDGLDLTWRGSDDGEHTGRSEPAGGAAPDLTDALRVVPPYGGRVKNLIDDVAAGLTDGQRVVIVTQQAARLAELFGERDLFGVISDEIDEPPGAGTLTFVQGGLHEGFRLTSAEGGPLVLLTDLEVFGWTKPRRPVRSRATAKDTFLSDLVVDELIVHVEHGVGRYRGLIHLANDGVEREYLHLDYAAGDRLFVPIEQADRVSRYVGAGDTSPTLHRLGGTEWSRAKDRVKKAVQRMARELLELFAARELTSGHSFAPDTVWQRELEASFPYVETPDQLVAIADVKADMERARPMDRLLCGDVGYGKTEVALRAAFKAVMDGFQVAVLVPTTVLAQQHYSTFRERMQAFPVRIEVLSRFRSEREQQNVVEGLADGSVDICIGTHRLIQKDVAFKNLGLVVIDEEQRFGVAHKERLKQLRKEVDVLTLTATPIPRTLHMSLAGVRDMSTMETAPEDRLPIRTFVQPWDDQGVREAILREIDRGGQVYFVHNRVQTIYQRAQYLQKLVPEAAFIVGHGQLTEDKLEKVMIEFAAGRADVLICTTIIESGLDIPNVNTIIVDHADRFGLAQLYQLRGRVGRGANRAYAYFLYQKNQVLTEIAERRLRTIFEANELGAGFRIAMKDLEIRGAGNLLGPEQSGHVAAVGFHLYTELLAEAVGELRGQVPEKRAEVTIDLPVDAFLPDDYVEDEDARLSLYRRLASASRAEQVGQIVGELRDRYGPLPERALDLIWLVQLRTNAAAAGVTSISASEHEIVVRLGERGAGRFRALEPRFKPYMRAGRTTAFLDRVGLGVRWREVLDRLLAAALEEPAAPVVPSRAS